MEIGDYLGQRWRAVGAIVDTRAFYLVAPSALLEGLGIRPYAQRAFQLADGSLMQRDVGEVRIRVAGGEVATLAVFEQHGDDVLLGSLALESLALAVDPVNERLLPMAKLPML
jgi:predicted aspartyl protease